VSNLLTLPAAPIRSVVVMKEETAPTCIIVRGKPADSKNLTNPNSIYNVTMGNCQPASQVVVFWVGFARLWVSSGVTEFIMMPRRHNMNMCISNSAA
jgi:hypothetical protein